MTTTDTEQHGLKKYWPIIKIVASHTYDILLWLGIVGNAYTNNLFPACAFAFLLALNMLEGGLDKIATAIRTQRNFHIFGDANEINLRGSSLYADSVTIKDRGATSKEACQ